MRLKATTVQDLGDGKQAVSLSSVEGSCGQGAGSFTFGEGSPTFEQGAVYELAFTKLGTEIVEGEQAVEKPAGDQAAEA